MNRRSTLTAIATALIALPLGWAGVCLAQDSSSAVYPVLGDIAIELPSAWQPVENKGVLPPAGLASYGPPFHLSKVTTLTNEDEGSILQLATSDNPLLGHDAYWLDTQMHAGSGSGMSMPDFLLYLFLPPSTSCMDKISQNYSSAIRVSTTEDSDASDLQVSYDCPFSATLWDFYAARVSSGLTFRHGTTRGSRAVGKFRDFYVAPMEEMTFSGMTFFVFEAQQTEPLSQGAADYFNVPEAVTGAKADFFWAIGAPSPFPFVREPGGENGSLLHVAYATVGTGSNKRNDFIGLLQQLQKTDFESTAAAPAP